MGIMARLESFMRDLSWSVRLGSGLSKYRISDQCILGGVRKLTSAKAGGMDLGCDDSMRAPEKSRAHPP